MTQPLAGQGGRRLGRSLLTVANVITAVAPVAADWNDSHIFNKRWPGHARFHGVTALAMAVTLSSANIWLVWADDGDRVSPGTGQRHGDPPSVPRPCGRGRRPVAAPRSAGRPAES